MIVTGLGQLYLGWAGPWQLLGGLIPWWIKAGGNPPGRLSGLFDYANITGSWLALVWPFGLAALLQRPLPWQRRALALLLAASLVASLYLTDSRNAWGALVLALPIVVGPASWLWLLPLLLLAIGAVALASLPLVPTDLGRERESPIFQETQALPSCNLAAAARAKAESPYSANRAADRRPRRRPGGGRLAASNTAQAHRAEMP